MKKLFILIFAIASGCGNSGNESGLIPEITSEDILTHIYFLADDSLKGREAGTESEAIAANYLADNFESFGLRPAGEDGTYFQHFTINTAILRNPHASENAEGEKRRARNVIGYLKGKGNNEKHIIIGAHYDHLGYGSFGSLYRGETREIHNGADDNASGTSGLLELAHFFSSNPIESNLLFIAFSGEEMGLLGSQYYVENPTVPLSEGIAMINMDMIGRLSDNNAIVFGVGTNESWPEIVAKANSDSISLRQVPDGTGSSDHTSFYNKEIPVLHYFTDTHADYHRPSDDSEFINADGMRLILEHVKRVVLALDGIPKKDFTFTEAPGEQRRNISMNGPTLGVLPDYGYTGAGMRITGVTKGRAGEQAGLKSGDIIVKIGDIELKDIYGYMESLNTLKEGEKSSITVIRDGKTLSLTLNL